MWFSSSKQNETSNPKGKSGKFLTAGFLFNPRFGEDIKQVSNSINIFVRLIATVFAGNDLFPKDHPALRNVPGADLSMGEVISTAYHSVSFTKQDLPRAILFVSMVGVLVFSALTALTGLILFAVGSAHAADGDFILGSGNKTIVVNASNEEAMKFIYGNDFQLMSQLGEPLIDISTQQPFTFTTEDRIAFLQERYNRLAATNDFETLQKELYSPYVDGDETLPLYKIHFMNSPITTPDGTTLNLTPEMKASAKQLLIDYRIGKMNITPGSGSMGEYYLYASQLTGPEETQLITTSDFYKDDTRPDPYTQAPIKIALPDYTPDTGTIQGCEPGASIFSSCGRFDMAAQWLDYLFLAGINSDDFHFNFSGIKSGMTMPLPEPTVFIQRAMRSALSFFSHAMLFFAGLILCYYILEIAVDTAHTGKPFGKANQLWAPIRICMALGLLIPLASGLNGGQYITIQLAHWGSGFASQAWGKFSDKLADKAFKIRQAKIPNIETLAYDILYMRACYFAVNEHQTNKMSYPCPTDIANVAERLPGIEPDMCARAQQKKTLIGSRIKPYVSEFSINVQTQPMCGKIAFPMPPDYRSMDTHTNKYVNGVYEATSNTVLAAFFSSYGSISEKFGRIANNVLNYKEGSQCKAGSATAGTGCVSFSDLNEAIRVFREEWLSQYNAAVGDMVDNADIDKTTQDTSKTLARLWAQDGWVSAGSWFNHISRIQGAITSAPSSSVPVSDVSMIDGGYTYRFDQEKLKELKKNRSRLGSAMTGSMAALRENGKTLTEEEFKEKYYNLDQRIAELEYKVGLVANNKVTLEVATLSGEIQQELSSFKRALHTAPVSAQADSTTSDINYTVISSWGTANAPSSTGIAGYLYLFIDYLARAGGMWGDDIDNSKNPYSFHSVFWNIQSTNPFADLAVAGHKILNVGSNLILLGFLLKLAGGLASAAVPLGVGGLSVFLVAIVGIPSAIAGALSIPFIVAGITLFSAGILLTFMIPMIPFIKFFFAVMAWVLSVFEAIVAMPFFALAHLSPYNDGLLVNAKTGYGFLFSIFLRPILSVFGLIAAFLIYFVAITFLNKVYLVATAGTGAAALGDTYEVLSRIMYTAVYAGICYTLANTCFKLITVFPDQSLSWMNVAGPSTEDMEDEGKMDDMFNIAMVIGGQRMIGEVNSGLDQFSGAMSGAQKKVQASKDKKTLKAKEKSAKDDAQKKKDQQATTERLGIGKYKDGTPLSFMGKPQPDSNLSKPATKTRDTAGNTNTHYEYKDGTVCDITSTQQGENIERVLKTPDGKTHHTRKNANGVVDYVNTDSKGNVVAKTHVSQFSNDTA